MELVDRNPLSRGGLVRWRNRIRIMNYISPTNEPPGEGGAPVEAYGADFSFDLSRLQCECETAF